MVFNKDLLFQNSIFRCHVCCWELYQFIFLGCSVPFPNRSEHTNIIDHDIFCRVLPFQLITGKGTTQYIWGWSPSQDSWQGAGLGWDSLHVQGSNNPGLDWHPEGSTPDIFGQSPTSKKQSPYSDLQLFFPNCPFLSSTIRCYLVGDHFNKSGIQTKLQ